MKVKGCLGIILLIVVGLVGYAALQQPVEAFKWIVTFYIIFVIVRDLIQLFVHAVMTFFKIAFLLIVLFLMH